MSQYQIVLNAVLPVFSIVALGAVLRRANWLTLEADATLMHVTINVLVPCLIFESILGNRALEDWRNVWFAPVVGIGTVFLGYVLSYFGALLGNDDPTLKKRRTFAFTTGTYNYGYIPLPLALILFDHDTVGVLFLHNVGVELAIWTAGLAVLTGVLPTQGWKHFINAPLITILITGLLNVIEAKPYLPNFFLISVHMLGQCAVPIGVLLIGATTIDYIKEVQILGQIRVLVNACLIRLFLLPILFLAFAKWLPCSVELKRVIVLQAAMPSAIFSIVMAKYYGGDVGTAINLVLGTSLVSLVTIPIWIQIGLNWIKIS